MSRIATRPSALQANENAAVLATSLRKDGIHYLDQKRWARIARDWDIALDADGVFKKDHKLLDECRRMAFRVFGSDVGYKHGFKYTINDAIGAKLGTIHGYNTGPEPMQAIVAVNRLTAEENPTFMGISFARLSAAQAFRKILSNENAAVILDGLRAKYLDDSDKARTAEMFHFYHVDPGLYKHPSMARFMVEVPGSTRAVMDIHEHCATTGKQLSIYTDTPNRATLLRHFEAVGFEAGMIDRLNETVLMVTQADVKHRKPHPEGLSKIKRDKGLLYGGDTGRDGLAVHNTRAALETDEIEFAGVLSGGSRVDVLMEHRPVVVANDIGAIARLLRETA